MEQYHTLIGPNPKVAMLHASLDEEMKEATKWARKEAFPWPTIFMEHHKSTGLEDLSNLEVPETVLVDKDGTILTRDEEEAFARIAALK